MPLTISRSIDITQKRDIGRNDPCHCGSGKKYKKCHLVQDKGYTTHERGGYVSRVIGWMMQFPWFKEALADKLHKIYGGDLRIEEEQMAVVVEALIYEWKYQGKTPLQHFVTDADLNPDDRAYYQSWIDKTVFSFLHVEEVILGTSLLLRDMFSELKYVVFEESGSYSLQQGMVVVGRLVPFQDGWMMTGGCANVLPQEMVYIIEREKKMGRFKAINEFGYIDIFYKKSGLSALQNKQKNEPGPTEQILVRQMMSEAQRMLEAGDPTAEAQFQSFAKQWFEKPQKELFGKTPREAILAERKALGNPRMELTYSFSMNKIDYTHYDDAIRLMQNNRKYLQALHYLAEYNPDLVPEPFRWYNNIGICLIRLGEMNLAKKYFTKAVKLHPGYEMAQTNLANYKNPKVRDEMELWGTQECFLEIIHNKTIHASKKLLSFFDLIRTHSEKDLLNMYSVLLYTYDYGVADIPPSFNKSSIQLLQDQHVIAPKSQTKYILSRRGIKLVEDILDAMYMAIPRHIRTFRFPPPNLRG